MLVTQVAANGFTRHAEDSGDLSDGSSLPPKLVDFLEPLDAPLSFRDRGGRSGRGRGAGGGDS